MTENMGKLSALVQPHSACLEGVQPAQETVPSSLLSQEKKSLSSTVFLSFTKQLRKENHMLKMAESFPGCQGGEVLRTLLAQSRPSVSIRKSGSGLCYPSVKKVSKQLSTNSFQEECKLSFLRAAPLQARVCAPYRDVVPVKPMQLCWLMTAEDTAYANFCLNLAQ